MSLSIKFLCIFILSICNARDTAISYVPVVMLGYDPVAFHFNVTGCKSMRGDKNYSYHLISADQDGIDRLYEFWFADMNNLNIFKNDPWRYTPRFGGFSSFGMCCQRGAQYPWSSSFVGPSSGPDRSNCGFRIHTDGYLYFTSYKSYDARFFDKSDVDNNIELAKARWISWYGSLESGPFNFYCFSTNGHLTTYDCIENGQRFAPTLNKSDEIYPIDRDYYDEYFDKFNNNNDKETVTTKTMCVHTAECRTCPDGSCQDYDENCNILPCPASSYLIWGIIGLIVFLIIVVCIAFICCIRKKNDTLRENFEQLNEDETKNGKKTIDNNHGEINDIQTDQDDGLLMR